MATFAAMRRLIAREQISGRAPSGFALEINVSQRLTVVVADDEAASVVLFDIPRRREAARGHCLQIGARALTDWALLRLRIYRGHRLATANAKSALPG